MRIDVAIRLWTRNVKMACNSMERWAFCERCGWDLERLYLQICHCGQTDSMCHGTDTRYRRLK